MPSGKNIDALGELKEKLAQNSVLISTGFTGLDVATMTDFRQKLREQGLEYRVVKNTIASLAADEIGSPQIKEVLNGPTGLILGNGDPIAAAKLLTEYLRANRIVMPLNGAIMDGEVISAQDVNALGLLPTKPVLMSMLMGQLSGVAARLARALNNPVQALAIVLERSTESSKAGGFVGTKNPSGTDQPDETATKSTAEDNPETDDSNEVASETDDGRNSIADDSQSVVDGDDGANIDASEEPALGEGVSNVSDDVGSSEPEDAVETDNGEEKQTTDT